MTDPTNPFAVVGQQPEFSVRATEPTTPVPLSAPPLPELPAPVQPVPDLPPSVVSLTKDELSAMLRDAVAAGAAQAQAANALGAPAIVAEVPEDWSLNRLLREMADRIAWHTERKERAAYAAIDKHAPAPTDGV